jgi:hypothetical protein
MLRVEAASAHAEGGAVAHCEAITRKYQEMAKEYECLAEMHKTLATQAQGQ